MKGITGLEKLFNHCRDQGTISTEKYSHRSDPLLLCLTEAVLNLWGQKNNTGSLIDEMELCQVLQGKAPKYRFRFPCDTEHLLCPRHCARCHTWRPLSQRWWSQPHWFPIPVLPLSKDGPLGMALDPCGPQIPHLQST